MEKKSFAVKQAKHLLLSAVFTAFGANFADFAYGEDSYEPFRSTSANTVIG